MKCPSMIADSFNKFFANVGPTLSEKIPKGRNFQHFLNEVDKPEKVFRLHEVNDFIIRAVIKRFKNKKSSGMDGFSNKVLKDICPEILPHLTKVINLSIRTGQIPVFMKTARIIPVFKKGDDRDLNNYRPISILSVFGKVLEKVVEKQLRDYLEDNNLLFKNQFGFRSNFSTNDALLKLMDFVSKGINSGEKVLAIFLDLKKAFDTCNHDILLHKLEYYGIKGVALVWFHNYIKNRQQYTTFGADKSKKEDISCGVPQGSILGPLLFLVYVNDIDRVSDFLKILYCDDTTLAASNRSVTELFEYANHQLNIISEWFASNKLTLHPSKTYFVLFNSSGSSGTLPKLELCGHAIAQISSSSDDIDLQAIKYVGVLIDEKLSFKPHIESIRKRAQKYIFMINRAKKFVPQNVKVLLFNALIKSLIEYGIVVWGSCCKYSLQPLVKIQKKAIRSIHNVSYCYHTLPLFQSSKIMQIGELIVFNYLKTAFRIWNNKVPVTICDDFCKTYETITRGNKFRFHEAIPRTELVKRLPHYRITKCWNGIDSERKLMQ